MNRTSRVCLERELLSATDQMQSCKDLLLRKQNELQAAQEDYAQSLKIYNDLNETLMPSRI